MKPSAYYRDREQTYLKHFFLEKYLERVAYNIGSFDNEFVYVDGFSGPWKSEGENFEDTSFKIAIEKLRQVREGIFTANGRRLAIRCVFVEKDVEAFRLLQTTTEGITDLDVSVLHSDFESAIPDILKLIGSAFSLVFIDPTGWTGFGLNTIAPVLRHRGEVLVNFMFDHINRFVDTPTPEASFGDLFGGTNWESIGGAADREAAIVALYRERFRAIGEFDFVTSTRILKPTSDRSYFYLVYGTRHLKGLLEFRKVEQKVVEEQERVRLDVKQIRRERRTGMESLFPAENLQPGPRSFDVERQDNLAQSRARLIELLKRRKRVDYLVVLGLMLEFPLVWESDVRAVVLELRASGVVNIENWKPRQRVPNKEHVLVITRQGLSRS